MKGLALAFVLTLAVKAQTLWIAPPASENGQSIRSLFENPDKWRETRPLVSGLLYTDLNFNKQFRDDELRTWFAQLRRWNIKLGMEVGAVKEWGQTGEKTFSVERLIWERIARLGGEVSAVAMDEPLVCVRQRLKKPDQYAVEETAKYIALVRQAYPQLRIGDIETYPSTPLADHFWWIEALNKRLGEMGVRGLDFYRLDVNWVVFYVHNQGNWNDVKKLEAWCRTRKLPFSLIYWPADYPPLQKKGLAGDETWYVEVMRQGYDYALCGGAPDEYVIESWVGAPSKTVPETGDFTFTRTVLDFARKFVKKP